MDKRCYCCDNRGTKENLTNIDAALDELGMLSVTTESRKQYLQEISGRREGSSSTSLKPSVGNLSNLRAVQGGFCVFHMNKKFVTDLVTSSAMLSPSSLKGKGATKLRCNTEEKLHANSHQRTTHLQWPNSATGTVKTTRNYKMKSSTRSRFYKPYEIPWHHKLEERIRNNSWNQENEIASTEEATSSSSSSSAAGNRSNPGSPSKSGRSPSGSGLLRSRSLDDLTCPAWDDGADVPRHNKEEIEKVSQQMRDLQVN